MTISKSLGLQRCEGREQFYLNQVMHTSGRGPGSSWLAESSVSSIMQLFSTLMTPCQGMCAAEKLQSRTPSPVLAQPHLMGQIHSIFPGHGGCAASSECRVQNHVLWHGKVLHVQARDGPYACMMPLMHAPPP